MTFLAQMGLENKAQSMPNQAWSMPKAWVVTTLAQASNLICVNLVRLFSFKTYFYRSLFIWCWTYLTNGRCRRPSANLVNLPLKFWVHIKYFGRLKTFDTKKSCWTFKFFLVQFQIPWNFTRICMRAANKKIPVSIPLESSPSTSSVNT